MSTALVPKVKAYERDLCGECGARLTCNYCETGDLIQKARKAISDVVSRPDPGRNAMARVAAAKIVLDKDFLTQVSDEDFFAEAKRRTEALKKAHGG